MLKGAKKHPVRHIAIAVVMILEQSPVLRQIPTLGNPDCFHNCLTDSYATVGVASKQIFFLTCAVTSSFPEA